MTTRAAEIAAGLNDVHAQLMDLAAIRDPEGVLSVYTSSSAPGGERHGPHAAEIALRTSLEALQADVDGSGPRSRAAALRSTIARLRSALADLADPTAAGLGRALFAPLSGADHRVVITREPMEPLVMLAPSAGLRPLVGPLDAGRAAGIVAVSGGAVRAVSVRQGSAEEALFLEFDDQSGEWRRLQGPASSNPAQAMQTASQRDLFERRLNEHRRRFVADAAEALLATAAERGWNRLCIAGSAEMVGALADETGERIDTVRSALVPRHDLSAVQLAEELRPDLDAARERHQAALVHDVRNAALAAKGTAVLGIDDVLTALAEGRVHRLLLDARREVEGSVAPDGRLVRAGQRPAGVTAEDLSREPYLVERIIERVLLSGGELVPLVPSAADGLAEWDGCAAFLRW